MIVRILSIGPGGQTGGNVTLDIITNGHSRREVIINRKDLMLNMGDTIVCIAGEAYAMINPGSPAGGYILKPQLPFPPDGKTVTVLTLDINTTAPTHRGSITHAPDIGNLHRGTATFR